MSHHGSDFFNKQFQQSEIFKELTNSIKSGEIDEKYSKQYPAGQLNENDEGVIAFRITSNEGKIIIDFGKSVFWLGLEIKEAKGLVDILQQHIEKQELIQPLKNVD